MGIGYAAFNTELKISGTSKVTSNWDIEITNVTPGTPTGSAENTVAPKWDALTASMEADLYEKGDAMEYDVTIENKGTIDAKLNNILTNLENSNSEAVNITFSGYTKGEILKSKAIKVIHVKIEYNPNYEGGETSSEVEIDFDYGQNNDETSPPENTHLVKYDCTTNGGNDCSSNNEYLVSGTAVDLSKTGSKNNYDFVGWNTDSKATEALTELTVGDTDITLYAIFKAKDTTPPIIDNISTSTTSNSITVVVAAHDDESGIKKYEFSINDGEYIDNGNNNVYTFTGLKSETSYSIKLRVTNEVGLRTEKEITNSIDIKNNITTLGDGLYKDEYENRYVYKGANPNNYVHFNNELWRIISVENDGSLKILRNELLSTSMNWNNTLSYLNSTYLDTIKNTELIDKHDWSIGPATWDNTNLLKHIQSENSETKTYDIGLITASEYIRANSDIKKCGDSVQARHSNCTANNWMYLDDDFKRWWTLTEADNLYDDTSGYRFFYDVGGNGVILGTEPEHTTWYLRPAIYLKHSVQLKSGEGSQTNPYILGEGITTSSLAKPIFSENGTNPKTVTITYPEGCGSTLICTYQKNNENVVNVTSDKVELEFTEKGSIVAEVSNGTNKVNSSYTVIIGKEPNELKKLVVTEGDGLYKDEYETGRYIYKGANPNNYMMYNNELVRILSIEADGTIKIIGNTSLVFSLKDFKELMNSLSEYDYPIIINDWNIGTTPISYSTWMEDTNNLIDLEEAETISSYFGTITLSEYVRANSNINSCSTASDIISSPAECFETNWINKIGSQEPFITLNADQSVAFYIAEEGNLSVINIDEALSIYPSAYLSSNIILSGTGTESDPYKIFN